VRKHLGCDSIRSRLLNDICDLAEQPLGCLCASFCLTEARVVGRVVLEVLLDVVPAQLGNETLDVLAVLELFGVRRLLLDRANLGIKLSDVEEVASAAAVLLFSQ
jgi:hypothetical protein